MKKILKVSGIIVTIFFAIIGFVLTSIFLATYFHITDVLGKIDSSASIFNSSAKKNNANILTSNVLGISEHSTVDQTTQLQQSLSVKFESYCQLKTISLFAGDNANKIYTVYNLTNSDELFEHMVKAVEIRMQTDSNFNSQTSKCANTNDLNNILLSTNTGNAGKNIFPWVEDLTTWHTLTVALQKDKDIIHKSAELAGIEPRILVAPLFVEQFREYTSERELFKSLFKPLQVLATSTNFSMGVMNIKEDTAKQVEDNLKNPISPFYIGPQYEHLLDFATTDSEKERHNRLSSYSDHSYSYLYGALYIAELEHQWRKFGFPIDNRPEIIATLFNIGFAHSIPKLNPSAGGAEININGIKYTFGGLAYEFYYSGELTDEFPYNLTIK